MPRSPLLSNNDDVAHLIRCPSIRNHPALVLLDCPSFAQWLADRAQDSPLHSIGALDDAAIAIRTLALGLDLAGRDALARNCLLFAQRCWRIRRMLIPRGRR